MEHGIITAVRYSKGVVSCDIQPIRISTQYENVPMLKPHEGFIAVPKQGDKVTTELLTQDDGSEARFITNVMATAEGYPEEVGEGDFHLQVDSDTTIAVTDNGAGGHDVRVSASGTVSIDAETVLINGTDFDTHTHDYDDSGTAETTGPPQ